MMQAILKMAAPIKYFASPFRKNIHFRFTINSVLEKNGYAPSYCGFKNVQQKRYFGQPASITHPHLVNKGEVTPGITKQEYDLRRTTFMQKIITKTEGLIKNHIAIFPSAPKVFMSYDIPYPFRQNTEFLYLSGFQEPDSVLVLRTTNSGFKSVLFVQKRDPEKELWDGPRSGVEGSLELTGTTEAYNIDTLEKYLYTYCVENEEYMIWYNMSKPVHEQFHKKVFDTFIIQDGKKAIENPTALVQQQRIIKSPAEILLMESTCEIASQAFIEVMKFSRPEINESHLYAKMDYECRIRNAEMLAYPPVVAGGDRANIIHYIHNNQFVSDGELVLMDAGCEYHGYTSDITRTWPVSGEFTRAQRKLYLSVLAVQEVCISMCTRDYSLADIYKEMLNQIAVQLVLLKLVPGKDTNDTSKLLKAAAKFCPHHIGHYLGMDVHDTSLASKNMKLVPGMIITIEPGIYIKADREDVKPEYRGIGIRIEDNVLITKSKPIVLTKSCPKHPDEIERLMSQCI